MACYGEKEMAHVVRGYPIYKDIRAALIGEELVCSREPTNVADRYAVVVMKGETISLDTPRKIFKICSVFLRRGGSVCCNRLSFPSL